MADGKSTGKQGRIPLKELAQSPGRYLLSPNDDGLERRQARLARAQRRKSFAFGEPEAAEEEAAAPGILSRAQVLDLFNNCIKLAAENKINQQNTWDLKLIDYLPDLIKADNGEDTQTNFQKASCTLEASAKIYSCRVDSVHKETYKVLGGLHRSAAEPERDEDGENADGSVEDDGEQQESRKKDSHKKLDRAKTLESAESLNVKRFEASLNVDPLFHQTSAQFDEGGAKGLLLNNLSVYRGCEILFDSQDIPEKCMKADLPKDPPVIDLSFASDILERIRADKDPAISPSLDEILKLLDDPCRRAAEEAQQSASPMAEGDAYAWFDDCNQGEADYDMGEVVDPDSDHGGGGFGEEDGYASPAESVTLSPAEQNDNEADLENERKSGNDSTLDEALPEHTIDWLRGIPGRKNGWGGAEYWKFKKPKDERTSDEKASKETKRKKKEPYTIVYTCISECDSSRLAKPRDLRTLSMPQSKQPVGTLPDDLQYQVGDLLKFFLRPSVMCVRGRLRRAGSNKTKQSTPIAAWNDGGDFVTPEADGWDDNGEVDNNLDDLVAQPRKVTRIEVNYDKTSKQVDVRALKETLWERIQESSDTMDTEDEQVIQFSSLLERVPENCPAAAPEDLSVHLCFICLLHLANEHNLIIKDVSAMDELLIQQAVS